MNYLDLCARDLCDEKTLEQKLEYVNKYLCDPKTHESYKIIGVNNDSFICHKTIYFCDERGFERDYYAENGYITVAFNDNHMIYSEPATQKQKRWLISHDLPDDISSYQAWHIINNAIRYGIKRKVSANEYRSNTSNCEYDEIDYYSYDEDETN